MFEIKIDSGNNLLLLRDGVAEYRLRVIPKYKPSIGYSSLEVLVDRKDPSSFDGFAQMWKKPTIEKAIRDLELRDSVAEAAGV